MAFLSRVFAQLFHGTDRGTGIGLESVRAAIENLEVTNDEKHKVNDAHPDRKFVFCCDKPDDFQTDDIDSVYALKLNDGSAGMVRFKVSKCSTVFFAAVYMAKYEIFHSGLVIENDFEVTVNGVTTTYEGGHLVAHAMFVRNGSSLDTKLLVTMCSTRDGAFNELASVVKNAEHYTRAMSPGFVSSTPCFSLVEKLRIEISKPFDKDWSKRLTDEKVESLSDNITNCAIFAGRIFYSLAPSADKQEVAVKGTLKVFKELGISESKVQPYVSALTK